VQCIDFGAKELADGPQGVAAYCAKYVSKAVDQRCEVPWVDRRTGELMDRAGYRAWSASRGWGDKMSQVKAGQRAWAEAHAASAAALAESVAGAAGPLDNHPEIYTVPDCGAVAECLGGRA
jgi:hypothetical protein